jgi:YwiC-like protein
MSTTQMSTEVSERARWRAVAVSSEHGGWGLTLEPVLLGLLVAWSAAGVALAVAAFIAFLVRTPLKIVAVDIRRHRWLPRSRLALRIAIAELVVLASAVAIAVMLSGWDWLVPVVVAAPLVAVELSYDIRSRGRRLIPELCGAIAIAASGASIVLAAGGDSGLAVGVWLIIAARAIGAIPFVRVQIVRLRRGTGPIVHSDVAQIASLGVAAVAVLANHRLVSGFVAVVLSAVVQSVSVRRPPIPAKRLGLRQMAMGLALVAVTAAGVAL